MKSIIPVIVGPTGSGKTGVAIEIAKEVGGEIVSADSRTVYKGMDVGTAKPSMNEREGVQHWGFDLVEPGSRYTVVDWKMYAEAKIEEIEKRGKVPIVVGGTGLYIDALVFDYKFEVAGKGYGKGRGACTRNLNGKMGSLLNLNTEQYPDRQKMCTKYRMFGVKWSTDELKKRLYKRADLMFNDALYDEVRRLVGTFGWDNQAMKSDVYQFAWMYLNGKISRGKAVELNMIDDWHLAKRQMTWFKRNKNIVWLSLDKIKPAVIKCIQNEQRK